ncbi:SDR family NAD(P)-dependent oxidoreductase [Streptomyces otsuchiensis]|uniref:SDR family NAD(P)-dependent oxidoreductase n=1 Tax=Streptomyces otsuchiensis TaxID=2681388 RepID=UPI001D132276|nr:SDR family oxidoreductase [Streptomyces otsuchiensis]
MTSPGAGLLQGRVVMVTGASSGIGAAAARLFAAEGASVTLLARRTDRLESLAAGITAAGGSALPLTADVCQPEGVAEAVARTVSEYGRLDAAFNNAGWGTPRTPLHLLDDSEYDQIMDVNVRGVLHCLRYQIPAMLRSGGGAVVLASSTAGVVSPGIPSAPYIAAKHAVIGLAKAVADEYGAQGVRANALVIGATRTELMQSAFDATPGLEQRAAKDAMLGRVANAEEIAQAALWLCSDRSSYVTGAAVPVDGGFTAR